MPSLRKELFGYPAFHISDGDYREYWRLRKLTRHTFNSFQRKRAALTVERVEPGSSLMDIGAGNGKLLSEVHARKPMKRLVAVDISPDALAMARENGLETIQADITDPKALEVLPPADYILFYEVLEHMDDPESALRWSVKQAAKGVFLSVPNTGYMMHRLRLLFGRFPLQWRARPSEHLRFWTVRDMRWWLARLGYAEYCMELYEGPRLLSAIWPSLFGRGIWVFIPRMP